MISRYTAFSLLAFLSLATPAYAGGSQPVSVTAATPDIVITPSPGTGTFTIGSTNQIHDLGTATSYTVLSTDMGYLIRHASSIAVAVSLPQAGTTGFEYGKSFSVLNTSAGVVTYTPVTSTVNGLTSIQLNQYQGATFTSTGSNYLATISGGTSGAALLASQNTFTAGNAVTPATVAISTSTFTPNLAASNNHTITLVHASCPCTLANPTNITPGESGIIAIAQSASGSDLVSSYGSFYVFTNAATPTLTTTANATDYFAYYVQDATHIRMSPILSAVTPFPARAVTSGASDTATAADNGGEVAWNKASGSASAESIPACSAANNGFKITVTDGKGDAATNNITITPASGTVNNGATLVMNVANQSVTLHCVGSLTNYTKN